MLVHSLQHIPSTVPVGFLHFVLCVRLPQLAEAKLFAGEIQAKWKGSVLSQGWQNLSVEVRAPRFGLVTGSTNVFLGKFDSEKIRLRQRAGP